MSASEYMGIGSDITTIVLGIWSAGVVVKNLFSKREVPDTTSIAAKTPATRRFRSARFWRAFASVMWPTGLIAALNWHSALVASSQPLTASVVFRVAGGVAATHLVAALGLITLWGRWRNFEFHQ